MDIDESSGPKEGKVVLVIFVGAPGSGKSTFCEEVMRSSTRTWVRVCQDTIGNGKAGNKAQCLSSAASALKEGKSVFIYRCNLDREERSDFVKLGGGPQIDVHAVVLDLPAFLFCQTDWSYRKFAGWKSCCSCEYNASKERAVKTK